MLSWGKTSSFFFIWAVFGMGGMLMPHSEKNEKDSPRGRT